MVNQLVPVAETYLIPGASCYMGDILLAEMGWEGNGKLADAIRTGRRPVVSDWTSGGMARVWVRSEAPGRLGLGRALEGNDEIWHLLDIAAREGLRVLGVACGLASMTLALARQNPGVSLTLNDWPPVVESALVVAKGLGIRRQVTSLPGDIRSVDFGKDQYDLIWTGYFLYYFGPEQIVKILKRLNRALAPGGVLVVCDYVYESCRKDARALLGSLWLFGVSDEGNLYTLSEWIGFLKQADFVDLVPVSREGAWHIWFKASKP